MTTTTTVKTGCRRFSCRPLLCLSLCFMMLLSMLPLPASAAEKTVIIHDFSEKTSLTYDQYNALRTGSMSAVKKNKVWYYQFKTDKITLLVKPSAFSSSVGNDYTNVNAALTSGVMTASGIAKETRMVYKERSGVVQNARATGKIYSTYFSYLSVTASRVDTEVDLICRKFAHVEFEYSEKIPTRARGGRDPRGQGKTPSTANEYMQALKRSTSNQISTSVTPEFALTVKEPGSDQIYLNSAMYRGMGSARTSANITDSIEVAVTTATKAYTGTLSYADLYSLYKQVVKLKKSSSEYLSNDKIILSKTINNKTHYCLSSEFNSPINLKRYNDYFRTEVRLTGIPSTSGTQTQLSVTFRAS